MVVKYIEDFVGLDGRFYESKVASDCSSIRLVPDCGGMMSAVFLYRGNDQSMIIPFSVKDLSQKMVYLDNNILDIHISSGIIDLSGFKAVKMSKYIELNAVMKSIGRSQLFKKSENVPIDSHNIANDVCHTVEVDARNIVKDICHAVEFNDDSFEHLFETMKYEGEL